MWLGTCPPIDAHPGYTAYWNLFEAGFSVIAACLSTLGPLFSDETSRPVDWLASAFERAWPIISWRPVRWRASPSEQATSHRSGKTESQTYLQHPNMPFSQTHTEAIEMDDVADADSRVRGMREQALEEGHVGVTKQLHVYSSRT